METPSIGQRGIIGLYPGGRRTGVSSQTPTAGNHPAATRFLPQLIAASILVTDYTFIRRYDSLTYRVILVVLIGLSLVFALGTIVRPISLLFSAMFGIAGCLQYNAMRRQMTSGLTINTSKLAWFCDANEGAAGSADLSSIVQVDWQRADSESVTIMLSDSTRICLDQRFFGNGASVLSAIQQRNLDVDLRKDGRPWKSSHRTETP